ncbi:MAG: sodium-dependent bicarbonate transport family permease, partial [Alphaproteobacteria bacterium]
LIGYVSGEPGMQAVSAFIEAPFKGVLCLFMLDMGLLAGRRLAAARLMTPGLVAFGLVMPLLSASLGLAMAMALGLSPGTGTLLMTLAASSSYIAVPAAMRIALPQANPAIYVTLSLAVTFPFNLSVGLPLYYFAASNLLG